MTAFQNSDQTIVYVRFSNRPFGGNGTVLRRSRGSLDWYSLPTIKAHWTAAGLAPTSELGHQRSSGGIRARFAHPRQRTCSDYFSMSVSCQKQTLPKPTGLTRLREDRQSARKFETGRDQPSCAVPTQQDWPGDTLDRHATA